MNINIHVNIKNINIYVCALIYIYIYIYTVIMYVLSTQYTVSLANVSSNIRIKNSQDYS